MQTKDLTTDKTATDKNDTPLGQAIDPKGYALVQRIKNEAKLYNPDPMRLAFRDEISVQRARDRYLLSGEEGKKAWAKDLLWAVANGLYRPLSETGREEVVYLMENTLRGWEQNAQAMRWNLAPNAGEKSIEARYNRTLQILAKAKQRGVEPGLALMSDEAWEALQRVNEGGDPKGADVEEALGNLAEIAARTSATYKGYTRINTGLSSWVGSVKEITYKTPNVAFSSTDFKPIDYGQSAFGIGIVSGGAETSNVDLGSIGGMELVPGDKADFDFAKAKKVSLENRNYTDKLNNKAFPEYYELPGEDGDARVAIPFSDNRYLVTSRKALSTMLRERKYIASLKSSENEQYRNLVAARLSDGLSPTGKAWADKYTKNGKIAEGFSDALLTDVVNTEAIEAFKALSDKDKDLLRGILAMNKPSVDAGSFMATAGYHLLKGSSNLLRDPLRGIARVMRNVQTSNVSKERLIQNQRLRDEFNALGEVGINYDVTNPILRYTAIGAESLPATALFFVGGEVSFVGKGVLAATRATKVGKAVGALQKLGLAQARAQKLSGVAAKAIEGAFARAPLAFWQTMGGYEIGMRDVYARIRDDAELARALPMAEIGALTTGFIDYVSEYLPVAVGKGYVRGAQTAFGNALRSGSRRAAFRAGAKYMGANLLSSAMEESIQETTQNMAMAVVNGVVNAVVDYEAAHGSLEGFEMTDAQWNAIATEAGASVMPSIVTSVGLVGMTQGIAGLSLSANANVRFNQIKAYRDAQRAAQEASNIIRNRRELNRVHLPAYYATIEDRVAARVDVVRQRLKRDLTDEELKSVYDQTRDEVATEDLKQLYNAWSAETDAQKRDNVLNRAGFSETEKADIVAAFDTLFAYRQGAQFGGQVGANAASMRQALGAVGLEAEVEDGANGEVLVRFGQGQGLETEIRFVQTLNVPEQAQAEGTQEQAAHEAQPEPASGAAEAAHTNQPLPDGMFVRAPDGTEVDVAAPVRSVIEIQEQSQDGSTFLLGHELAHNLLDVLRRTGNLTAEQDAALAEHFKDENGNFDEEAFADAFAEELRGRFAQQENAKLAEAQGKGGKIRQLLRTLADTVAAWAYAAKAMVWRRHAQAPQAQPLGGASSVLEAFLQQQGNHSGKPNGSANTTQSQREKTFTGEQTAQPNERNTADSFTAGQTDNTQSPKFHVPPPADENIAIANEGVTEESFAAALDNMLKERFADGRIAESDGLREAASVFYKMFRDKKVPLSDGRLVYFVPLSNEARGLSRDEAWAEYAIHSVTNDRTRKNGTHERAFNSAKADAMKDIERILKEENVFASVNEGNPERNAIVFIGEIDGGKRIEIVTRLDEAGNINADLTEITTVVKNKGRKSPRLTSLAEAVRAVRQGTGYPPMTKDNKANTATDVKFHTPSQADAAYLKAVDAGDMESAQRMVEETAERNGYKYSAFHGTNAFGFTVFDPAMSDDGISLFFSSRQSTAASYTESDDIRRLGDHAPYVIDGDIKTLDDLRRSLEAYGFRVDNNNERLYVSTRDGTNDEIVNLTNEAFYRDLHAVEKEALQTGDIIKKAREWKAENAGKEAYRRDLREVADEVLSKLNARASARGIYDVALKMDNPFVVDAKGSLWDKIDLPSVNEYGYTSTRRIAEYAKEHGYDGVIIKDVQDFGLEPTEVESDTDTVYIAFSPEQVKSLDPVTYDEEGKVVPLSERFDPNKQDIRWHVPSANAPRFSETREGKVAVAEVFDAMVEGMWDLIADPTTRSQRKGNRKQQDVTTEEGFVKEVNVRMGQFGRAGGKRLQEVKQNLSAEQWLDVLGTVFELGHRFDVWHPEGGLLDVSMRQRVADYLQDILRNRASALGRRAYLAGRDFAWKQAKAAEAEALAEARAKAQKRVGEVRERKDKEIAEQKERFKEAMEQARWDLADERFLAKYELAKAKALAQRRVERIREEARETVRELRVRQARKDAAMREVGVTMKQLIPQLGMDVGAELVRIAYSEADIDVETERLIKRIGEAFEAWVLRERPDLADASYAGRVVKLTAQGERAYAETVGNLLKAMARELEYGRGRESIMNLADAIRHGMGHDRVTQALEGKLARTMAELRKNYVKHLPEQFAKRMKRALSETRKALDGMSTTLQKRVLTEAKRTIGEIEDAMKLAVEGHDGQRTVESEIARLQVELTSEQKQEGEAREAQTEREHRDGMKLLFLQRFGGLAYMANPMEAYENMREAEAFVPSFRVAR